MSDAFRQIYAHRAEAYDRMVAAEDCEDRLLPAIQTIVELQGLHAVEVGIGTGRVTRLLLRGGVGSVLGVDDAPAMVDVARRNLGADPRLDLHVADASALPAEDASADLVIAGWVFGHQVGWYPDSWRSRIGGFLQEVHRVVRTGGTTILIETLGTGAVHPAPPNEGLASYYRMLEDMGFSRVVVSTDYRFDDAETAAQAMGFFFGQDFAQAVRASGAARVPEWTGVWFRVRA